MKKAFTLAETVIAMAVIAVVTFCFFTMARFANASFQKSSAMAAGSTHLGNIKTIFDASTFSVGGTFSTENFGQNLSFAGYHLETVAAENFSVEVILSANGQRAETGPSQVLATVAHVDDYVTLSGQILSGQKVLYELPPYQKAVSA